MHCARGDDHNMQVAESQPCPKHVTRGKADRLHVVFELGVEHVALCSQTWSKCAVCQGLWPRTMEYGTFCALHAIPRILPRFLPLQLSHRPRPSIRSTACRGVSAGSCSLFRRSLPWIRKSGPGVHGRHQWSSGRRLCLQMSQRCVFINMFVRYATPRSTSAYIGLDPCQCGYSWRFTLVVSGDISNASKGCNLEFTLSMLEYSKEDLVTLLFVQMILVLNHIFSAAPELWSYTELWSY